MCDIGFGRFFAFNKHNTYIYNIYIVEKNKKKRLLLIPANTLLN